MARSKSNRFDINQYLQTSRQRSYFVVSITVGLLVLVVIVGILPAYSAIVNQRRENRKRDEGIAQLEDVITQYQSFISLEETLENEISLFNEVFPSNNAPQEDVILDVINIGSVFNIEITSISFSDAVREVSLQTDFLVSPQVESQRVSITISGTRDDILSYVQALEDSRRIYNIINVVVSKNQGEVVTDFNQEVDDFNATISAEFYWTNTETASLDSFSVNSNNSESLESEDSDTDQ